jgi:arabinogalactan oligomer/maltooligosaccharide transport system permease protein
MYEMISNQFARNSGEFAVAEVLSGVQMVIVLGLLQKYIAAGLVAGSVKG